MMQNLLTITIVKLSSGIKDKFIAVTSNCTFDSNRGLLYSDMFTIIWHKIIYKPYKTNMSGCRKANSKE